MAVLNALLVRVADLAMRPLAALPDTVGVAVVALVTALVILWLVRATSDQPALAAVKRQIQADLFEMRLYNDDMRALLRAQGRVLVHNGRYLRLSLVPLLCSALPLALAIAQLQAWYGYTGLTAGTEVLVSADLAHGAEPQGSDLRGPGVTVNGPSALLPEPGPARLAGDARRGRAARTAARCERHRVPEDALSSATAWRDVLRCGRGRASWISSSSRRRHRSRPVGQSRRSACHTPSAP